MAACEHIRKLHPQFAGNLFIQIVDHFGTERNGRRIRFDVLRKTPFPLIGFYFFYDCKAFGIPSDIRPVYRVPIIIGIVRVFNRHPLEFFKGFGIASLLLNAV